MSACETQLRDGQCEMDEGHRGRHTTVAHYCDVCGRMRRGQGYPIMQRQSDGYNEWVATMCFLCSRGLTPIPRDRADLIGA